MLSIDSDVTSSKWATMACVILPVLLSKNLIGLSSGAVIVRGRVGWDTTRET